MDKWSIDVNHRWMLKAINNEQGDLYGACLRIWIRIGDVEVEQKLFVHFFAT